LIALEEIKLSPDLEATETACQSSMKHRHLSVIMYCNSPAYNHQPLAEVSFFKTRPPFHHTFTKSSAFLAECQPLLTSIHHKTSECSSFLPEAENRGKKKAR
jgi:hypothetical protein